MPGWHYLERAAVYGGSLQVFGSLFDWQNIRSAKLNYTEEW